MTTPRITPRARRTFLLREYADRRRECVDILRDIVHQVADQYPRPDADDPAVAWHHVAELVEVRDRLLAAARFLHNDEDWTPEGKDATP